MKYIFSNWQKGGPNYIGMVCLPYIKTGLHINRPFSFVMADGSICPHCKHTILACLHVPCRNQCTPGQGGQLSYLACVPEPAWDWLPSTTLVVTTDRTTPPAGQEAHFSSISLAREHESCLSIETTCVVWGEYVNKHRSLMPGHHPARKGLNTQAEGEVQ